MGSFIPTQSTPDHDQKIISLLGIAGSMKEKEPTAP